MDGTWGNSRVSGYIAVDDVTFFEGACSSKDFFLLFIKRSLFYALTFSALPDHAQIIRAECTFDRDSCSWRNSSTGEFEWRLATVARRPANLPDKTYGGAPVGYAYFDIFNTGSR